MRKINLLPWREELRREAQRNFMILLIVAAVAAAGCVFAVNRYFDAQISNQNQRNAYLNTEIAKLDRQIARIAELDETRSRLLERKQVIEDLQANRTLMVRLFDQLVRTVPTGIRLLNARQVGDQITINGVSQSNARVSTYLRNLEASAVLHNPQLRIIEAETEETDSQMPYMFTVAATVAPPETLDDETRNGTEAAR
ncbi:MAG TPA: PilN domain-containing protein [Wenzhouxiangellaceae bacterium]|nr:PilN domain-containing protein [Wenzhouxiangellaceae bacterium]